MTWRFSRKHPPFSQAEGAPYMTFNFVAVPACPKACSPLRYAKYYQNSKFNFKFPGRPKPVPIPAPNVRKIIKTINALVTCPTFRSFPDINADKPTRLAQRRSSMPFGRSRSQSCVYFFSLLRHNGDHSTERPPYGTVAPYFNSILRPVSLDASRDLVCPGASDHLSGATGGSGPDSGYGRHLRGTMQ